MTARRSAVDIADVVFITDEELACGFQVVGGTSNTRRRAVMNIGHGLRAVKTMGSGGQTQYLVCDEHLVPLYAPANSLSELRSRFPVE